MLRGLNISGSICAGLMSAVFALGAPGQASAATKEVLLASPGQAMTYCQSGKMPSGDVAYISGAGGLAQYGPGANCVQQVPASGGVKKAIQDKGKRVSECNLTNPKAAIKFCQGGGMGEYDIGYIDGKVGTTLSGPGYGCVVNSSSTGIGNAICK